jgi:hypothetical protein
LGAVEVLLIEKTQVLEFLESRRQTIESEAAARERELKDAQAALEKVQSDNSLLLTNRPYLTNADYISAKADLDTASQGVESLAQAADKWRARNVELKAAASRVVQESQAAADRVAQGASQTPRTRTREEAAAQAERQQRLNELVGRARRDSSAFTDLNRVAENIFSTEPRRSVSLVGRLSSGKAWVAGETKELAEWRAFLQSAPDALKTIADKTTQKRKELESFEEKVRGIERAATAGSGQEIQSAEARVAAAKARLAPPPTAETYLANFKPTAVQKTHTDPDGLFSLTYPRAKEFVVFAQAERTVPRGDREKYYWLVNAPSGTGNLGLQLSNDNLARIDPDGHLQVVATPPSKIVPKNASTSQSSAKDPSVKQGNVAVRVVGGRVASVCWRDAAGTPQFTGPVLTVGVYVSNLSSTKMVDFETWRGVATLTDDNNNQYKRISVTPASNLLDPDPDSVSIHPQQHYFDRVLFEVPVRNFKRLHLKLPGRNFGGSGTLRFEIPESEVEYK